MYNFPGYGQCKFAALYNEYKRKHVIMTFISYLAQKENFALRHVNLNNTDALAWSYVK